MLASARCLLPGHCQSDFSPSSSAAGGVLPLLGSPAKFQNLPVHEIYQILLSMIHHTWLISLLRTANSVRPLFNGAKNLYQKKDGGCSHVTVALYTRFPCLFLILMFEEENILASIVVYVRVVHLPWRSLINSTWCYCKGEMVASTTTTIGLIRVKFWLFLAYVVSFVSLAASVGLLVQDALTDKGPSAWTGVAGVLQCVFVLISGLIFWTSHSE